MALEAMTMFYVRCDTCDKDCTQKKALVMRSGARALKEFIITLGWFITIKKQRILCPDCHRKEVEDHDAKQDLD